MTIKIERWPFLPFESRTPEETERWWAECYLPTTAERTVWLDKNRSVILSGCAGSGKSIAAAALARTAAGHKLLLINYPPTYWPDGPRAWLPGKSHLRQIMACAAVQLLELFSTELKGLTQLSSLKQQFLRWLIEKHYGERA